MQIITGQLENVPFQKGKITISSLDDRQHHYGTEQTTLNVTTKCSLDCLLLRFKCLCVSMPVKDQNIVKQPKVYITKPYDKRP